jgi:hypothetical protein
LLRWTDIDLSIQRLPVRSDRDHRFSAGADGSIGARGAWRVSAWRWTFAAGGCRHETDPIPFDPYCTNPLAVVDECWAMIGR